MHEQPVRFLARPDRAGSVSHGRDKALEGDDPYELVGVHYPIPAGVDGDREVARCFVEEFALMGWTPERIRGLFTTPHYTGAREIVERRGMGLVDEVIAETFGLRHEAEER